MGNIIKFNEQRLPNSIKSGGFNVGVNNTSTDLTGFYNGITPILSGYTIYIDKVSNGPSIYAPQNDNELVGIVNSLGGSVSTATEALVWINSQSNMTVVNGNYPSIVTDGLVLNLDAGFVSSYPRTGTTWTDLSGNGNNGTLVNGPTFSGDSIVFDGVNDVGTIGVGNNYPYPYHTFDIWVKSSGLGSGMVQGGLIGLDYGRVVTIVSNGNIQYALHTGVNYLFIVSTTEINVFDNNWHHIICSRGESVYEIYVDGVLNKTGGNGGQPSWNGLNVWSSMTSVIANNPNNNNYRLSGGLSSVRMYNRQLSQQEILQNYYAGLQRFIPTDGLVLSLDAQNTNLYATSPTTAYDISGNNNNGTLINGTQYVSDGDGSWNFDGTNDTISLSQITTTNKQPWTLNFWYKLQQVRRYSSVDYALFTSSTSSVPGTIRYFGDYYYTVFSVDVDNNGDIYVGGNFLSFNGYQSNKIIKLNSSGIKNDTFNIGQGFKSGVSGPSDSVEVQVVKISSSGKIYVGGTFTFYNDVNANRIIRLNTDGTIDTSFNYGTGFNGTITNIEEDSNGNIYVVGSFTTYKGQSNGRIIKLDQFGNKDTSFNNLTLNNTPYTLYLDELESKLYVGGAFTLYGSSTTNRLVRLNLDGSLDTTFDMSTGFNNVVWKITKISDKLYVGGSFTSVLGQTRNRMVSLNLDGTINTSFDIGTGFNTSDVTGIVWDGNGIVVVGGFTQYQGVNNTRVIRLLTNGNKDTTFINEGFNGFVKDVKFKNNVLYVVGDFTYYGDQRYPTVIRLNSSGNLITNNPNLVPSSEFLEIPTLTNSRSFWSYIANYSFENNISEVPNSSFSSSSLVSFSSLNGYIAVSSNLRKFNLNETITISGYFKKNTLNTVWVGGFFGNARTFFNLNNGNITSQQSNVISNSITDIGNGWYRCSCTYNFTNPIGNFYLYGGFGSNENGSLFVTGMQIKIGGESEYYKNDLIPEGVYRPRILFISRNSSGTIATQSLYLPTNLMGASYQSYEYVNNLVSDWNLFTLKLSSSEIIDFLYNGEIGVGSGNLSTSQENFLTFSSIGAFTNFTNSLLGNISNVNLYQRELTQTEITTIYNATKSRYGL